MKYTNIDDKRVTDKFDRGHNNYITLGGHLVLDDDEVRLVVNTSEGHRAMDLPGTSELTDKLKKRAIGHISDVRLSRNEQGNPEIHYSDEGIPRTLDYMNYVNSRSK
tara:strand:- start:1310 stop:1630 length:321 start_codon:yes stop_codon:yes gene_type:complete